MVSWISPFTITWAREFLVTDSSMFYFSHTVKLSLRPCFGPIWLALSPSARWQHLIRWRIRHLRTPACYTYALMASLCPFLSRDSLPTFPLSGLPQHGHWLWWPKITHSRQFMHFILGRFRHIQNPDTGVSYEKQLRNEIMSIHFSTKGFLTHDDGV